MAYTFKHRMDELDLELSSNSAYTLWTKRAISMLDDLSQEIESASKDFYNRLKETQPANGTTWGISKYVAAKRVTSGMRRAGEEAHAAALLLVRSHRTFNGLYVVRHGTKSKIKGVDLDG